MELITRDSLNKELEKLSNNSNSELKITEVIESTVPKIIDGKISQSIERDIPNIINTAVDKKMVSKQNKLIPGNGVTISESNEITFDSSKLYKAGDNIVIDDDMTIHARIGATSPDEPPHEPPRPNNGPLPVINLKAEYINNAVTISWEYLEDTNRAGVKIIKNSLKYPTSIEDGEEIYSGTETSVSDSNLIEGKFAYYRAFTYTSENVYNQDTSQLVKIFIKRSQERPDAPVIERISGEYIVVKEIKNGEYRIGENGDWVTGKRIIGLTKNTQYTVYQRRGATRIDNPSEASEGTTFTTQDTFLFTVRIDNNDENPLSCCSYRDDANGLQPEDPIFDERFGIYPCLVKNGVETVKLNPNNYKQTIDGREIDITSGDNGDVMICIPLLGYKFIQVGNNERIVDISITNETHKPGFCYYPFEDNNGVLKDKLYFAAYPVQVKDDKARSISAGDDTFIPYDSNAKFRPNDYYQKIMNNNSSFGNNFRIMNHYHIILIQCLAVIKFKRLDINTLFPSFSHIKEKHYKMGIYDDSGMFYKDNREKYGSKFFGMEYFVGSIMFLIDGIWVYRGYLQVSNKAIEYPLPDLNQRNPTSNNFNIYSDITGYNHNLYGLVNRITATNDGGFIANRNYNRSNQTAINKDYCSYQYFVNSRYIVFSAGGSRDNFINIFTYHNISGTIDSNSETPYNLWCRFVCHSK